MDIERLATTEIINRISFCEGLSPFINDGDKEPSWDGHIYVYPNDSKNKAELTARVPVQVKGKHKTIKKNISSLGFKAEVSDLRNYATEGGVIYFGVAVNDDRSKQIFYKSLLPFDLRSVIKSAGKNKTKYITLQIFPDDDKAIRQIFLSFISDRKRQATQIVWSEEDAIAAVREGAVLKFHIQPKDVVKSHFEVMREATMQSFYLYVQTKEGVEIPFGKVDESYVQIAKQKIDIPVFIDNVKYYDQFYHGYENGKPYLYISDILRISVSDDGQQPKELTSKYSLSGALSKRIVDSSFLLALSQHKEFRIGDRLTHAVNINKPSEVSRLKKINDDLKRIKAMLDYFGVKVDLNMDGLTEIDFSNIEYLVHAAEINDIYLDEDNEEELPRLFYRNMKIGNILVRILAKKNEDSEGYRLFNAFIDNAHVRMEFDSESGDRKIVEPWSLFILMKSEDFLCSNINYDVILNSINTMKSDDLTIVLRVSETQTIDVNNMLLEIINAYDSQITKNERLLQFSIDMADILLDNDPVSIINKLQVIKRQRPLSNDEISELVVLRNEPSQTKTIRCAISILLGEIENAKKLLDEIPEEDRIQITDYPIHALIH